MMERKFYTDFEKHLKDNADDYKMYPSKKVWHGLYNDLHPGKRWPSATISILFLFMLVILGHLNTGKDLRSHIASTQPAEITPTSITSKPLTIVSKAHQTKVNEEISSQDLSTDQTQTQLADPTVTANATEQDVASQNNTNSSVAANRSTEKVTNEKASIEKPSIPLTDKTIIEPDNDDVTNADGNSQDNLTTDLSDMVVKNSPRVAEKNKVAAKKVTELTEAEKQQNILAALKQKRKEHISWTYYITPSISYRRLMEAVALPATVANGPLMSRSWGMESSVDQKPFLGLELGSSLNYKLSENLKIKTGLQLNYSNYSIRANTVHPTNATLILKSSTTGTPYTISAVSLYGNKTGISEVTLHNYSLQISAPIGLEYMISGNETMQFGMTATFQPSFVMKDRSYILSTNKMNYMSDKSLMRTWNMATNVGAFVSFQSNSFKWQIGPQLHYQLKSTYTKNYPVQEHLTNYGIRFGVSKLL